MPKTFLRVWLILWVSLLPLVHIHPEADHAHGMAGHAHGGTFHTVLSSTPVCAYEDHQHHHDSFSTGESFGSSASPIHTAHGLEHDTYSFSALNSSLDLDSENPELPHDGVVAYDSKSLVASVASQLDTFQRKKLHSIFPNTLSPRAPPILSV